MTIARKLAITSEMRRIPSDHVRAVAVDFDRCRNQYRFADGSAAERVVTLNEAGRPVTRYQEVA